MRFIQPHNTEFVLNTNQKLYNLNQTPAQSTTRSIRPEKPAQNRQGRPGLLPSKNQLITSPHIISANTDYGRMMSIFQILFAQNHNPKPKQICLRSLILCCLKYPTISANWTKYSGYIIPYQASVVREQREHGTLTLSFVHWPITRQLVHRPL